MSRKQENFNITRVVPLTLSTSDIKPLVTGSGALWDPPIEDNIGLITNFRTRFRFKNINLETLLGDLYYKYDIFNIELVHAFTLTDAALSTVLTASTVRENKLLYVHMSGLDFINSSFSQK